MKILRLIALLLLTLTALAALCSCSGGHRHTLTAEKTVAPSCSEGGYTIYVCDCGYETAADITEPLGHSFAERRVDATCTVRGYTRYVCDCGEMRIGDYSDPLGHSYETEVIEKTETDPEYRIHTCLLCGDRWVETDYHAGPEPADDIDPNSPQILELSSLFSIPELKDSLGRRCHILQGGCTDGKYYYAALNDGRSSDADSVSVFLKYDLATGELVAGYEGKLVAHVNDMTFNVDTNELIAVHNTPELTAISIFDGDTMELKEKRYLELEIYSMAYDPYLGCYWVGISYGYDFARLDLDFNQVGEIYRGRDTGAVKQGMDADSQYIYFLQYKTNMIVIYDKSGEFVKTVALQGSYGEPENIFHIGDKIYIGFFSGSGGVLTLGELNEG